MRFFLAGQHIMGIRTAPNSAPGDFKLSTNAMASTPGICDGAFVYVIRGGYDLIRLGVSTNPNARLAQLRGETSFPIEFAYICAVCGPTTEAFALKVDAKAMLSRQRQKGEWFEIKSDMAVAAIAAAGHKAGRKFVEIDSSQIDTVIRLAGGAAMSGKTAQGGGILLLKTLLALVLCGIAAFGVYVASTAAN